MPLSFKAASTLRLSPRLRHTSVSSRTQTSKFRIAMTMTMVGKTRTRCPRCRHSGKAARTFSSVDTPRVKAVRLKTSQLERSTTTATIMTGPPTIPKHPKTNSYSAHHATTHPAGPAFTCLAGKLRSRRCDVPLRRISLYIQWQLGLARTVQTRLRLFAHILGILAIKHTNTTMSCMRLVGSSHLPLGCSQPYGPSRKDSAS